MKNVIWGGTYILTQCNIALQKRGSDLSNLVNSKFHGSKTSSSAFKFWRIRSYCNIQTFPTKWSPVWPPCACLWGRCVRSLCLAPCMYLMNVSVRTVTVAVTTECVPSRLIPSNTSLCFWLCLLFLLAWRWVLEPCCSGFYSSIFGQQ